MRTDTVKASTGASAERVFVTPTMAADWLEHNFDNRKVIPNHVRSLEIVFRRGDMQLNGQTIKLSKTGRLLDGQHRLMACVNTGIGFWTFVVRDLEEETFDTIDLGGVTRRVKDVFGIRGEANSKELAATLNVLDHFIRSGGGFFDGLKGSFTVSVADSLLSRHPKVRLSITVIDNKRNVLWRCASACCAHYLFSLSSQRLADEFVDVLTNGSNERSRPFNLFRESLIRTSKLKARMSNRVTAARAIKAFNHEQAGTSPKFIRWDDQEDYPAIDGLNMSQM